MTKRIEHEYTRITLPKAAQEAINDPCVHNFAKAIIQGAYTHDITESYHDIEYALHIVRQSVEDALSTLGCPKRS